MIFIICFAVVIALLTKRMAEEIKWRSEQRLYWARQRKDLNEIRKACEQR